MIIHFIFNWLSLEKRPTGKIQDKLSELVGVAGLKQKLAEHENQDESFKLNWAVAKDWSEVSRYECFVEENKAKDLYEAVTDNKSGILAWLKKYW